MATRISPLPCSKELFPIGFSHGAPNETRPKAVAEYLLESMAKAGVRQIYAVLRSGKWDIPAYFQDGSAWGLQMGYLIMQRPFGVPYTVDQACEFVGKARVAFGFPDILFNVPNAFAQLLEQHDRTKADLVLGLFPAFNPSGVDMIEVNRDGRVTSLVIRPATTSLRYSWILAVWGPSYTRFLHDQLLPGSDWQNAPEVSMGHVIQRAIAAGLHINSVPFDQGAFVDIGTRPDLVVAAQHLRNSNETELGKSSLWAARSLLG